MGAPRLIGLLAWMSLLLVPQLVPASLRRAPSLATTTLRLAIVDGQGAPVVQLALRVEDAEGQPFDRRTDADGQTVVGPLGGPVCYIRTATLADGTALQVEPTTAQDGLRLGLIPGQERMVRLIADGGLLFLDPEVLFPADDPAEAAPDAASLPASAPVVAVPPAPPTRPASTAAVPSTAAASGQPVTARGVSRVLLVAFIAVVASTIVVLLGSFIVRRHG